MTGRPTTCYMIICPTTAHDLHAVADELKARTVEVTGSVDQSGVNTATKTAFARFRAETNDEEALETARQITEGRSFRLVTGYGFHQRDIAEVGRV